MDLRGDALRAWPWAGRSSTGCGNRNAKRHDSYRVWRSLRRSEGLRISSILCRARLGVRALVEQTRAERILAHLGTYHVSIREIMEAHLFDGKSIARELFELSTERGLIAVRGGLANRRSYYHLTARGASTLGLSKHWARAFGGQSLITNLSLAWFCCMGKLERRKVRREELAKRYRFDVPGTYQCIELDGSRFRVYRVYVPMPVTPLEAIERGIRERVQQSRSVPGLEELIEKREYGFAVLLHNDRRVDAVWHRIRKHDAGDGVPLAGLAHFRVESVPDFAGSRMRRSDVRLPSEEKPGTA